MKKTLILVAIALVFTVAAFAEGSAQNIIVQSIVGKVEYEASAGQWEAVTKTLKLSPSTVINTGLNSSLVLKMGDKVITIKAMQKGTIEKLSVAATAGAGGIKLGAKAKDSAVSTASTQERTNISTASTRASEAVEDVKWAE